LRLDCGATDPLDRVLSKCDERPLSDCEERPEARSIANRSCRDWLP
jgi:hypothetical protein